MKVIVFGREKTIQRLIVSLAEEGVGMAGTSDDLEAIMTLQKQGGFDLAIVDSRAEKAEVVCNCINGLRTIPLVLIVDERQANWEKLESLGASSYLPEGARDGELAARLRVILRRCWRDRGIDKISPLTAFQSSVEYKLDYEKEKKTISLDMA